MADNSLHNELVGGFEGPSETIVDKPKSIAEVMTNLGVRLKDETLKQIDEAFSDSSGNLRQSVNYNVKIFGESFTTELYLDKYYDFINKGVQGIREARDDTPYSYKQLPPPTYEGGALQRWCETKGMNVFAVSQSIFQRGLKGRKYFDRVTDDVKNGEIHELLFSDLKSAGQLGLLKNIKKQILGKK